MVRLPLRPTICPCTTQSRLNYAAGSFPHSVAVVDSNGDGRLDLAVANFVSGGNNVSVLLGNGDGTFQTGVDFAAGADPSSLVVADFNRDGKPDLAVGNYDSGNVTIFLNPPPAPTKAATSTTPA